MYAPELAGLEVPGPIATLLSWGPVGMALLAWGEKLIPVVPSYAMLIFLGMTHASDPGTLTLMTVAMSVGSTVGAICWYGCGRAFGGARSAALVERYGRYGFLSPLLYERMTAAYRRNQFWVTLCGQAIPVIRLYLPVPAGVIRLAPGTFAVATFMGSLLWNAPLLSLGYGLRGAGKDPLQVGLLAVGGLIATEAALLLTLRLRSGRAKRKGPCSV